MEKFRWAYIGCGGIAATTAEEILRSGEHEIVSVWNRTRGRAEAFAERFGGTVYDSLEAAILAPGVEGVYLAPRRINARRMRAHASLAASRCSAKSPSPSTRA